MPGFLYTSSGRSKSLTAEACAPRKPSLDYLTIIDCTKLVVSARYQPPQCDPEHHTMRFMRIWIPASAGLAWPAGSPFTAWMHYESLDKHAAHAATRQRQEP